MYRRVRLYHTSSPCTSPGFSHAHQTHAGSVWCLSQVWSFYLFYTNRNGYAWLTPCACVCVHVSEITQTTWPLGAMCFQTAVVSYIYIYKYIFLFFITGCCIIAQLQLAEQSKLSVAQAFHRALCKLCFFRWKIVFHMPNRWTDWESTWLSSRIAIREETFPPKNVFHYTITSNVI